MGNSGSMFKSKKGMMPQGDNKELTSVVVDPTLNNEDELLHDNKKSDEEIRVEQHHNYLNNMFNLKSLFKKLDPSVLNQVGNIQGEIKVSCKVVNSLLLVKVILAQGLTPKDVRGESADPYIKVELLVNGNFVEAEGGLNTTKVVKKTLNPVYNEIFSFGIDNLEMLKKAKIRFSVWCRDNVTNDDFVGEAFLLTENIVKEIDNEDDEDEENGVYTTWLQLKPKIDLGIGGEISVNLKHKSPQSLQVNIRSATNIIKLTKESRPYVRVYIPGVPYLHKTKEFEIKSAEEMNPVWDETFEFPILKEEMINKYLVLIVSDINDQSVYLGEVHISLEDLMNNHLIEDNFQLQDLRASVASRSRWAKSNLQEEFQQALMAHASYKTPNFFFSQSMPQAGYKAISVRILKASASSRLQLVDGILVH